MLLASPCMATPALPQHLPRVKRLNKNGFLFLSPAIFIGTKLLEVQQGAAELVGDRTSSHRVSQLVPRAWAGGTYGIAHSCRI